MADCCRNPSGVCCVTVCATLPGMRVPHTKLIPDRRVSAGFTRDRFVWGMVSGFALTCVRHRNKRPPVSVGYRILFAFTGDDESLQPAIRILEEKKSGERCSAVAEFLLPF